MLRSSRGLLFEGFGDLIERFFCCCCGAEKCIFFAKGVALTNRFSVAKFETIFDGGYDHRNNLIMVVVADLGDVFLAERVADAYES